MDTKMSDYTTISLSIDNHIAHLSLDAPTTGNSLTYKFSQEILAAVLHLSENKDVRAIILRAEGNFFCVGGDLKSFHDNIDHLSQSIHAITVNLHSAIMYLHKYCAPVVCAIQGTVAGGGIGLALCGDHILTAEHVKFNLAYTNAGLSPDCSTSYMLPRLIGLRKTQDLMFNNTTLTAQEALNIGLTSQITSAEELDEKALEIAQKWASGPVTAYRQVKTLLSSSFDNSMEKQLLAEANGIGLSAKTDGKKGIEAFVKKQKPNFT
jgi:2-(1,2-epoxy-1,2-dihydrophenyl)acetyl-CoA isomerase